MSWLKEHLFNNESLRRNVRFYCVQTMLNGKVNLKSASKHCERGENVWLSVCLCVVFLTGAWIYFIPSISN